MSTSSLHTALLLAGVTRLGVSSC